MRHPRHQRENPRGGLQMNVQIIEKNGKPEWAVVPFREYQKLREALDDAEDRKDLEEGVQALREGAETTVPGEVTFAILDGMSPIRAWREHKQIKMSELAKKAGISSAYLSQIEKGRRNPTIDTLKAIAGELGIDIEMLI
ncbi:MAG: helix-turn-helix domain-containing protein [Thermodesulfobacteriota bacterium]